MAALYYYQEKLIFRPTQLTQDHVFDFGHPYEELFLETSDGASLNGLLFKADSSKGLILYYHGNRGDLTRWGNITSYFLQYDYDVLVMDYRTYGKSTGKLSETALYDDAQLFYYEALQRYDEDDIVVYGRSLGCTFASYVSARNDPGKLILESPFYSLVDLVKSKYPILPVRRLLKYRFPTSSFVPRVSCPSTVIHGTEDFVVPYESGERLSQEFTSGTAELITVPGGAHNNLIDFTEYRNAIEALLRE